MKKDKKIVLLGVAVMLIGIIAIIFATTKKDKEAEEVVEASSNVSEESLDESLSDASSKETSDYASSEESLTFPDTREYTQEQIELMENFEPEGAETYEVDEEESPIHVTINNFVVIANVYDDWKLCNELPYYLHTYFNLCTGNLDERYVVTLTEGSVVCTDSSSVITFEATVDKYPDMVIYIEYSKLEREFGIKSDLGDYSLDALRQNSNKMVLSPSGEDTSPDTSAPNAEIVQD